MKLTDGGTAHAQGYQSALDLFGKGDFARAAELLQEVVVQMPEFAEGYRLLSMCYYNQGKLADAESTIRSALSLAEHDTIYLALGIIMRAAGNVEAAADAYRSSLKLNPGSTAACNNLANIHFTSQRYEEAIQLYEQALRIQPEYALAHKNLGMCLRRLNRYREAERAFKCALFFDKSMTDVKAALAEMFMETGQFDKAIGIYKSMHRVVQAQTEMRRCVSWRGMAAIDKALLRDVSSGKIKNIMPSAILPMHDVTPTLQQQIAYEYATQNIPALKEPPLCDVTNIDAAHRPLRIGYLCSDFYNFVSKKHLSGVFEAHDRSGFEATFFIYNLKRNVGGSMHSRAPSWPIVDISRTSDRRAAQQIVAQQIDILVELNGYDDAVRHGITALRPAPVIVNWPGYPGTFGHKRLADYIIGDAIVTPDSDTDFYTERLALTSGSFQPDGRHRPLPDSLTRAEVGLSESAFVFCSFNRTIRFNPRLFDLWARLLLSVPNSVLWLLDPEAEEIQRHIRQEFEARDVPAERILLAPRLPISDHIARLRLADLALDPFPYSSRSATGDALWAGVPVVTLKGGTFASRLAASQLSAHGFPETVTHSETGYFGLAFELATNPRQHSALKNRLAQARTTSAFFDEKQFTRNLEALYRAIIEDYNGLPGERRSVVRAGRPSDGASGL